MLGKEEGREGRKEKERRKERERERERRGRERERENERTQGRAPVLRHTEPPQRGGITITPRGYWEHLEASHEPPRQAAPGPPTAHDLRGLLRTASSPPAPQAAPATSPPRTARPQEPSCRSQHPQRWAGHVTTPEPITGPDGGRALIGSLPSRASALLRAGAPRRGRGGLVCGGRWGA